jgi:hypothetical protein
MTPAALEQPGASLEVLDELIKGTSAAPKVAVEKPQAAPQEDVDQSMIDRLTGGGDADGPGDRT